MSTENRKLSELRVVDLHVELENRGLDKTGTKQVLVKRLKKVLEDEGLDPAICQFQVQKSPTKQLLTASVPADIDCKIKTERIENDEAEDIKPVVNEIEQPKEVAMDAKNATEASVNVETNVIIARVKLEMDDGKEQPKEVATDEKSTTEACVKVEVKLETDNSLIESDNVLQLTLDEAETFLEEKVDAAEVKPDMAKSADTKNVLTENVDGVNPPGVASEAVLDKAVDESASAQGASCTGSKATTTNHSDGENCNLWIKNIASTTKATQLKEALSKYGTVTGAKVVTNAKYPGMCYGYVTMNAVADANNCIAKLDNTELNGSVIRIAKVRSDHVNSLKLNTKLSSSNSSKNNKEKRPSKSRDRNSDKAKPAASVTKKPEPKRKSRSRDRPRRRSGSDHGRVKSEREILPYDKMIEKRERDRELFMQEQRSRRVKEKSVGREVYKKQRTEAARLERERIMLRMERDALEKEKKEVIKLKLEVKKIEHERELQRLEVQQVALCLEEEDRRLRKRSASYRHDGSYRDRKRMSYGELPEARLEPPGLEIPSDCAPLTKIRIYEGSSVFNFYPDRELREARSHQFASSVTSRIPKDSLDAVKRERSPRYRSLRDERDLRFLLEQKNEMHSLREQLQTGDPSDVRIDRSRNSWTSAHPSSGSGMLSKYSWKPGELR